MEKVFTEDLVPQQAIIVYRQGTNSEYYLESRRIVQKKLGFQMAEGRPLSKQCIAGIVDTIELTKKKYKYGFYDFLPKNLLYYRIENLEPYLIWSVPNGWYDLNFTKDLGIENGQCNLPTLIFCYRKNVLSVFACKKNTPDKDTTLFQAPFHNVNSHGEVCLGNAKIEKNKDLYKLMLNVEKAFFTSKFSHLQVSGSPINGNLNTYFNKLIKTKAKFDNKVLIKSKTQMEDLI